MKTQEQHDYLIGLIKELEKLEDRQALNNFIIVVEDLLKVKYRLRNYFDYPISAADYDELTTYAENLLGIPSSTGRTTPTSGGPSANSDVDSFNTMSDIEVEALVDYALIDMELVEYILNNYTPNQLTIDWVQQAAVGHVVGGVKVYVIDGMKVNKQTANYIEMRIRQIQEYEWVPNAETIAAIEEAANADPKDLHSWEDVKKEFFGDNTDTNYEHYWSKGQDAHFFHGDNYLDAWKCADIWHKEIYYWPYNGQYIVGQVSPVEWYKTKDDEVEWGPIFGPFNSPEELEQWHQGFWAWLHKLSDENKVIYHNIPTMDNQWHFWNTNYIEMFRKYAAIKSEYDYNKIAAQAQNDRYANMTEEEYVKLYYHEAPKAFTKRWNEKVAAFISDIKEIESNLEERNNEFDGEIIQDLERKLLNFLKQTL